MKPEDSFLFIRIRKQTILEHTVIIYFLRHILILYFLVFSDCNFYALIISV
jgi:hypothetical protein